MDLVTRLAELSEEGERSDAITLAKASLHSARDVGVSVDESTVYVETEHFRGTHGWHLNEYDTVVIDQHGEYTCTSGELELSFSTATMNDRALEKARARITANHEQTARTGATDRGAEQPETTRNARSEDEKTTPASRRPLLGHIIGAIK